jgi:hypothetical protein
MAQTFAQLDKAHRAERQFSIKQAETILRLRLALKMIMAMQQPPNPLDAADRLDRMKRMAERALKLES